MNKKQWILSVIAAILFCVGLLLMLLVSVLFSDSANPEPTESVSDPVTEAATIADTEPATEPITEPTEPPVTETTAPALIPTTDTMDPGTLGMTASHAFVYDTSANLLKYAGGDSNAHLAPASLTKLLTAYTALQFMDLDTIITVGEEVNEIDPESSVAFLRPGHKLSVEMLIQALMLPSGNDAAYTIAVAGGRILSENPDLYWKDAFDLFVTEMNEQSRRIGMTNSQFKNPDGIDIDGHYTTVNDLIILTKTVLKSDMIMRSAGTDKLDAVFFSGETVTWYNSNYFLHQDSEYYMPNAVGLKTGSTDNAGRCLISLFLQEDGSYLIIGVLGSESDNARYDDTLILYHRYM